MATDQQTESSSAQQSASFRLKAGLFPLTLVEVLRLDRVIFEQDLKEKVAQAPAFFQQTAVILSFDEQCTGDMPLAELIEVSRHYGLIPVVMRGGKKSLQQEALACGLALMPEGKNKATKLEEINTSPEPVAADPKVSPEPEPEPAESDADAVPMLTDAIIPPSNPNRVITRPIRSGQQVYSKGGDLIVLAAVSAGAEILADGNIHVYGPLRGRALAGVQGDENARIFCHSLEAELISIAGDFQISEDLRGKWWKKAVQISRTGDQSLKIQELS